MSEADRFRQQQQQQRARLAEFRQEASDEASKLATDGPRPPSQPFAASAGVVWPRGTAPGGSGGTDDTRPPREGEGVGAEPGIIRRANLLEGGQTIVLIDVETTGLGPRNDRVIQLAGKVCSVCVCVPCLYACACVLGVLS